MLYGPGRRRGAEGGRIDPDASAKILLINQCDCGVVLKCQRKAEKRGALSRVERGNQGR